MQHNAANRPSRGPAAQAKSRARAAAHQAATAAAASTPASSAQESDSKLTPAQGVLPAKATSVPLAAPTPLKVLPSPPASDGRRLVVSVGRGERLPSFSQVDGQDDVTVSHSSPAKVEDDIPKMVVGSSSTAAKPTSTQSAASDCKLHQRINFLLEKNGKVCTADCAGHDYTPPLNRRGEYGQYLKL